MKALMIRSGRPYSNSIAARLIVNNWSMASRKAGSVTRTFNGRQAKLHVGANAGINRM
jgi:hypothetical protein